MVLGRWLVRAVRRARGAGASGAGQLGERGRAGPRVWEQAGVHGVKRARPKEKKARPAGLVRASVGGRAGRVSRPRWPAGSSWALGGFWV